MTERMRAAVAAEASRGASVAGELPEARPLAAAPGADGGYAEASGGGCGRCAECGACKPARVLSDMLPDGTSDTAS